MPKNDKKYALIRQSEMMRILTVSSSDGQQSECRERAG